MEFLAGNINKYSENHTSAETKLLSELNRETWSKVLQPRMLSGHIQGRLLSMFSNMIRPKRILEIGTYTGYSALCLAEGLVEGGELHTIDKNEELETLINKYIHKSEYKDQIKTHIGNAIDIIPKLNEDWDIIFIDADKENYINYYKLLMTRLKSNSYIIADNVLWSGKVVNDPTKFDEETRILDEFNRTVQEDNRLENILLAVRDGLMVARVK